MSSERNESERYYTVINPESVQAAILPLDARRGVRHVAELREISSTGAVLLLAEHIDWELECQLSLAGRKLRSPLLIPARVRWMWPNQAGDWQINCAFEPHLTDKAFKGIVNSGLLERRAAQRGPVQIPVELQFQPDSPRLRGVVRNISSGGICLTTFATPESSRHVCIFVPSGDAEVPVELKVCWSTRVGTGYFIGCQFSRSADYAVLRAAQPARQRAISGESESPSLAAPFGACADALVLGQSGA